MTVVFNYYQSRKKKLIFLHSRKINIAFYLFDLAKLSTSISIPIASRGACENELRGKKSDELLLNLFQN